MVERKAGCFNSNQANCKQNIVIEFTDVNVLKIHNKNSNYITYRLFQERKINVTSSGGWIPTTSSNKTKIYFHGNQICSRPSQHNTTYYSEYSLIIKNMFHINLVPDLGIRVI